MSTANQIKAEKYIDILPDNELANFKRKLAFPRWCLFNLNKTFEAGEEYLVKGVTLYHITYNDIDYTPFPTDEIIVSNTTDNNYTNTVTGQIVNLYHPDTDVVDPDDETKYVEDDSTVKVDIRFINWHNDTIVTQAYRVPVLYIATEYTYNRINILKRLGKIE